MSFDLTLDLQGFSNTNVVKCLHGKSPLEYFARISDKNVFNKQIEILQLVWPTIDQNDFLEHVCSSSFDRGVWIYRKSLQPIHDLSLKITGVSLEELNTTLKRSMITTKSLNKDELNRFFNGLVYPNITVDWSDLIKNKCNPRKLGLRKNILYFMLRPPSLTILAVKRI